MWFPIAGRWSLLLFLSTSATIYQFSTFVVINILGARSTTSLISITLSDYFLFRVFSLNTRQHASTSTGYLPFTYRVHDFR